MESEILFFTAKERNYAECDFGFMNVKRKRKMLLKSFRCFPWFQQHFDDYVLTDDRINCTFSSKSCLKTIKK